VSLVGTVVTLLTKNLCALFTTVTLDHIVTLAVNSNVGFIPLVALMTSLPFMVLTLMSACAQLVLLCEIIDSVIIHMSAHFSNTEKWNYEKYDTYEFKITFSEGLILKRARFNDCELLKNELAVLYGSEDLKGNIAYEILQSFRNCSLTISLLNKIIN
jgi:hypothetical protein